MTTIAYHRADKTLAADRRCITSEGMIVGPRRKIGAVNEHIYAVAGEPQGMSAVRAWIEDGCWGCAKDGTTPQGAGKGMENSDAIVIKPDGEVVLLFGDNPPIITDEDFVVLGSGRRHAITALDMGGSAITAILMATKRDPGTGDGIERIVDGGAIERIEYE